MTQSSPDPLDLVTTVPEVVLTHRVSKAAVHKAIAAKRLPYRKSAEKPLLRIADVDKLWKRRGVADNGLTASVQDADLA